MTDMPTEAQHARERDAMSTTLVAAWAIIISLGGTQVWFNVASALRHSVLSPVPILAGLAPVLGSVLLSHLAASRNARPLFRCTVTAIMLASMAVSIGATIEVATPVFGYTWRAVLLGIVLDSASLAALWFIMDRHGEKRAAADAVDQAHAAVEMARQQASEATAKFAGLEAELTAARTDLDAARAEVQGLKSVLTARRKPGRKSVARKPSGSVARSAPEDTVSTEAQALSILAAEPEIKGKELGERLGVTESYGCRLIKRLAPVAASSEPDGQSS